MLSPAGEPGAEAPGHIPHLGPTNTAQAGGMVSPLVLRSEAPLRRVAKGDHVPAEWARTANDAKNAKETGSM